MPNPSGPVHPFTQVVAKRPRYLWDQLNADITSGHNVIGTVFVQCGAMYRADGPDALKPVGETDFVNGVAAMSASGIYGPARACAGIVGHADCTLGEAIDATLEAHLEVTDRFKGIRHSCSYDADPGVLGPLSRQTPGLYASDAFRKGYARLAKYGLSFDAWFLEPQLPEVYDLVSRPPRHPGRHRPRRRRRWGWRATKASARSASRSGGRTWPSSPACRTSTSSSAASPWRSATSPRSFPIRRRPRRSWRRSGSPTWRPCIELFGPSRCMFESNFPVDLGSCDYPTLWNAFKVFAKDYSAADKADLFAGTATRVYRLQLPN